MSPVYETLYCANHPKRETTLRCNRCDKPICADCAVLTPTGYRCKECVRGQQKIFDTAKTIDYPLAFVIAGVVSFIGSIISSYMGFFTIFIAPIAGVVVAEVVRWVVGRRRSKLLWQLATGGAVLGGLLSPLAALLFMLLGVFVRLPFTAQVGNFLGLIWPVIYVALVASTVYYRLSGIRIQ